MKTPHTCRMEAYQHFAAQMPALETTHGLLHAAIAISMHQLDGVVPADVDDRLTALAARVRSQLRGATVPALLAHLHQVLFEEQRFYGNLRNYYTPFNSYIPTVMETRRGIPITLCLIYKVVAERAGLFAEGINSPYHFLVRVRGQRDWMIIDPYFGGAILNREEAFRRIEEVKGAPASHDRRTLAKATHRQWIERMIVNLQRLFDAQARFEDVAAMQELRDLLDASDSTKLDEPRRV